MGREPRSLNHGCKQDLNKQDFEQKATKGTKGKSPAEFGGWTRHRKVRMVSTMADGARAEGPLLKQAETSPEFFVSFVTFCSKNKTILARFWRN
jgi:hypothetical protein